MYKKFKYESFIEDKLTFTKYINNLCHMASNYLRTFTKTIDSYLKDKQNVCPRVIYCKPLNIVLLYGWFIVTLNIILLSKSKKPYSPIDFLTEDTTFEDLLERDESKNIYGNYNTQCYLMHIAKCTLLIEIYKTINHISSTIMRNFFDLKLNQYNICSNFLLKLSVTSACRYGTRASPLDETHIDAMRKFI